MQSQSGWRGRGVRAVCMALVGGLVAAVHAATPVSGEAQATSAASGGGTATSASGAPKVSLKKWIRYPAVPAQLSPQAQLGREIFFDPSLSASGRMSCASCHSPDHAYGPPNGLAVQLGGPDLKRPGVRAVPSLRYMTFTPQFTRHYYIPSPEASEDDGPTGGFMRDGRAGSLHEQAGFPMLNPDEMANPNAAAVADKIRKATYADRFRAVFGDQVLANPDHAFDSVGAALEAFETEDPSFHPYTSKFDSVMSGNAEFTMQELRGYALFNNVAKGNCAKCHFDAPGPGGQPAQLSDYQFGALGVPRNPEIPANRDPKYFDMGLCGPYRRDLAKETDFCGLFKDPTLRNAATRSVFFHNGRFHTLDEVVHFYVTRDITPQKWYPRRNGKVIKYDDLPAKYRDNTDTIDLPFYGQKPGAQPVLSESEIQDVVAFIKTLNDGYSASAGGPARKQ